MSLQLQCWSEIHTQSEGIQWNVSHHRREILDQTVCRDFYRTMTEVLLNISVFQYIFDVKKYRWRICLIWPLPLKYLRSHCFTATTSGSCIKRRGSSLTLNIWTHSLHQMTRVLFSPSAYSCHPIAISSSLLPCFCNLTSFSANIEFIFVHQTFLGWGLLGNGNMKDMSWARRDV